MLNPRVITDAIVDTLRTAPQLVAAMGADQSRIYAYHYMYGVEDRLEVAVQKIPTPGMMVVWNGTQPANVDGQTMWKHFYSVYIRVPSNVAVPLSYEDVWWLFCNDTVNDSAQNIREITILPDLQLMDIPGIIPMMDEDRFDLFKVQMIIPEYGDVH